MHAFSFLLQPRGAPNFVHDRLVYSVFGAEFALCFTDFSDHVARRLTRESCILARTYVAIVFVKDYQRIGLGEEGHCGFLVFDHKKKS